MRTTPRFNMSDPNDLVNLRTPLDTYSANNFNSFCWDGVTPNYATVAHFDTMHIPVIAFEYKTYMDYHAFLSHCEYYDTAQIYYRVTVPKVGGGDSIIFPVTRLKPSDKDFYGKPCIEAINSYPTTNPVVVEQYDPILHNKTKYMTLRLPGIGMDNPLPAGATVEFQWVVYANPNWIKDSYRSNSSFESYNSGNNAISHSWHTPRYESICGDVGTAGYAYGSPSITLPFFYTAALKKVAVYEHQTFYWSNPTYTGNNNTTATNNPANDPTGARYAEYFVKMPSWLDLDYTTEIRDAFRIRPRDSVVFYGSTMPTASSGDYHGQDADGYRLYS
jgi:hypothetical protein